MNVRHFMCRSFVIMFNFRHITYNIAHLPYYADMSILPYSATSCNMAYLPYFRHGSSDKVVMTIVAYATILPSLLNRFSVAMPEMAGPGESWIWVAKNLSGWQKSVRCVCDRPSVCDWVCRCGFARISQLPESWINSSNYSSSSIYVKSATFCRSQAMPKLS